MLLTLGHVLRFLFLGFGVIIAAYLVVAVLDELTNFFRELRDIWKS
jgi:hypothetical protein